jgi:hypothetical protein
MNETFTSDGASDKPWSNGAPRAAVPDTSLLSVIDDAPPAPPDLLNRAVMGAHHTVDHLADDAAPVVQRLGDSVAAAQDALHAKADALRSTRDAWVDTVRTSVRGNPLAWMAGALTLGAVVARLSRSSR